MDQEIIVLQGPPACGKSTFAREFAKEHTNYVIVSRDAIREARGNYWIPEQEDYITDIETTSITSALKRGLSVIIDATNLDPRSVDKWNRMAKEYNVAIQFKEFYIPFDEAVKRDQNPDRSHKVGKAVLKKFYFKYYRERMEAEKVKTVDHYRLPIDHDKDSAIMCDLDGTVAWMQGRSPFSDTGVINDKPDLNLIMLLSDLYYMGNEIIFISGREGTENCRRETEEWLMKNIKGVDYKLFMRKEKDYRADEIIKKEIFENEIKDKYSVIAVFDDRNKVVNMWREEGLLCCQVAEGDF